PGAAPVCAGGPPLAQPAGVCWLGGSRNGGASLEEALPADAPQALARPLAPVSAALPAASRAPAPADPPAGRAPAPLCSPAAPPPARAPARGPTPAVRAADAALRASPAAWAGLRRAHLATRYPAKPGTASVAASLVFARAVAAARLRPASARSVAPSAPYPTAANRCWNGFR